LPGHHLSTLSQFLPACTRLHRAAISLYVLLLFHFNKSNPYSKRRSLAGQLCSRSLPHLAVPFIRSGLSAILPVPLYQSRLRLRNSKSESSFMVPGNEYGPFNCWIQPCRSFYTARVGMPGSRAVYGCTADSETTSVKSRGHFR
jgi:hypothetical protein